MLISFQSNKIFAYYIIVANNRIMFESNRTVAYFIIVTNNANNDI